MSWIVVVICRPGLHRSGGWDGRGCGVGGQREGGHCQTLTFAECLWLVLLQEQQRLIESWCAGLRYRYKMKGGAGGVNV
jgi:hypothetical protein